MGNYALLSGLLIVCLNTSLERSVEPPLACMCSLNEEKVCVVRVSFSAPDQAVEAGMLGSWLFQSSSLFSQVAIHPWLVSALSEHSPGHEGRGESPHALSYYSIRSCGDLLVPPFSVASFSAPVRVTSGSSEMALKKEN